MLGAANTFQIAFDRIDVGDTWLLAIVFVLAVLVTGGAALVIKSRSN